ncbi:cysteine dioxygenase [Segeticoccus rhizosphaerae]|uniref:cysteine dioxygenase n=1 Tax=Segeticoccus rhizosphaerae TaxID=1104777 RepID=UPI0010C0B5C2|nr:cysteine dioxygenase [Ornithinicoccus soli]
MTTLTGRTPGVDHFSGAQLLRTLHLFGSDPELPELLDLRADRRQRRELVETPYLQVWLVSWPVGAGSGWHDHRGAHGAHLVVRGELTEHSWFGGVHEERLGHEGRAFGGSHVHELVNAGHRVALSLHASAPARGVSRYVLRDGRLESVESLEPLIRRG